MIDWNYEKENLDSVRAHLKQGDLFWDIGAFDATTSLIASKIVGAENVAIIEPAEFNWPTIRKNWTEAYPTVMPRLMFPGFIAANTKEGSVPYVSKWPPQCGNEMRTDDKLDFRWLNYCPVDESCDALPRIALDDLWGYRGVPKGVMIDIEGAEFEALRGGTILLDTFKPVFWISIHPTFMKERFNHEADDLHRMMAEYGYRGRLLHVAQEEHWIYEPKKQA